MRLSIFFMVLFFAGAAQACIRNPVGFSFEDKINNEFAYLICLHNEQNDTIRKLANAVGNSNVSVGDDVTVMAMQREIDRLSNRVRTLEASLASLTSPPRAIRRTPAEQQEIDKMIEEMKALVEKGNPPKALAAP